MVCVDQKEGTDSSLNEEEPALHAEHRRVLEALDVLGAGQEALGEGWESFC